MKKILTISEPNCGGKPTGYAVAIRNANFKTLETEILKGLVKGWHFTEGMARATLIDEDVDALKEQGYTYLQERFIVEVTTLDDEVGTLIAAVSPFKKLAITANVKWDYDEGETPPDPKFEVEFTPDELEQQGLLARETAEWFLDEGHLENFLSEYLTSFTDFFHKGFTFGWECKR